MENDMLQIRRPLLVSLMRVGHALCRKTNEERVNMMLELLRQVDSEVFGFHKESNAEIEAR